MACQVERNIRGAGLWLLLALLALAASSGCRARNAVAPSVCVLAADKLGERIQQSTAPVTLVHVWATWCEPCREEFPELLRVRQDYASRGLELILVSADSPDARMSVERFLAERGVRSGSCLIDNPNAAFIDTLCTNWSGALPASFFFAPGGRLQRWWEGKAEYARYREASEQLLEQVQKKEMTK